MQKNAYKSKNGNANLFSVMMITFGLLSIAAILAVILYFGKVGKNGPSGKDFKSPQEMMDYSIQNTLSQKTYSIKGDLNLDMRIKSTETANAGLFSIMPDYRVAYNLDFNENIDQSEIGNEKSSANVGLDIEMSSEGGSDDYSANFDVMLFGKDFAYFKLNDFDLGMAGLMLGAQAKQYKGKWYMLDLEEMRKKSKGDFSFEKYSSEEVKKTLSKYKMIKFAKDLGMEKVDGAILQHYQAKIDPQAVLGYYKALLDMRGAEAQGSDLKKITSESSREFDEFSNKYYGLISEIIGKIDIEIWIGKKDFLIHKMSFNGVYGRDFVSQIFKKYFAEEQVRSRLRSNDSSLKYSVEREKENLDKYYIANKSYEGYKKNSSWRSSSSKSVSFNLNANSYVVWAPLESTSEMWCMDSAGREGYVPLDFNKWDCLEAVSESRGTPKDISELVNAEVENMKAEMDLSLKSDLVFREFNIPVDIKKPENAEDMAKMFNNM